MSYPAIEALAVLLEVDAAVRKCSGRPLDIRWMGEELCRLSAYLADDPRRAGASYPGLYINCGNGIGTISHFANACEAEWHDLITASEDDWKKVGNFFDLMSRGIDLNQEMPVDSVELCKALRVRLRPPS
jgi:hypothetical protein